MVSMLGREALSTHSPTDFSLRLQNYKKPPFVMKWREDKPQSDDEEVAEGQSRGTWVADGVAAETDPFFRVRLPFNGGRTTGA